MRASKGATISDVAKAAGVSVSSISHYLNDRQHLMRPETRERIRAAIEALNYTPNPIALQLKTGRTPMIGLLVPSVVNSSHAELAQALDSAAQEHGYRLIIGNCHNKAKIESAFVNELVSYGVRGIVLGCELKDPQMIASHVKRGVAFTAFDNRISELISEGVDVVNMDNPLATSMAVDHLFSLGHRHIAYATPLARANSRKARMNGYLSGLARHSLGEPLLIGSDVPWSPAHGEDALALYLQQAVTQFMQLQPRPTAIVAVNDHIAISLMAALSEHGIKTPEDVSIVGVDDITFSKFTHPKLSSMRPQYANMAVAAIDNLRTRLDTPKLPNRIQIFPAELIQRTSSAAPKKESAAV